MTETLSHVPTPGGHVAVLLTRAYTNDEALVRGVLGEDEYRLASLPPLTGWALDVGAHVGSVTLALALDHPALNVIAIEPVPENAALITRSVERAGLGDRVHVLAEAAGEGKGTLPCRYGYTSIGDIDPGYVQQNAYVGNIWRLSPDVEGIEVQAPIVTIDDLRERFGIDRFRFCKTDAEGAEWAFFADPRQNGYIDEIVGEYHDNGPQAIIDLLAATHDVDIWSNFGNATGIFRAVRR
jgi:FkbM family methyltransferase